MEDWEIDYERWANNLLHGPQITSLAAGYTPAQQLEGVTVTPEGNRSTSMSDWKTANRQEEKERKDNEYRVQSQKMISDIHRGTDKAAKAVAAGTALVSAPAWGSALGSAIASANSGLGRLAYWLGTNHPTTYAAAQMADAGVRGKMAYDSAKQSLESIQDMYNNGINPGNLTGLGIGALFTKLAGPATALREAATGGRSLALTSAARLMDRGITLAKPVTSKGVTLFNPSAAGSWTDKSRQFLKGYNNQLAQQRVSVPSLFTIGYGVATE